MTRDNTTNQAELRRAPGRSVVLDSERGIVTKLFRGGSARARLFDRRRARAEFENLQRLSQAGVRVPAALGIERESDGTWCVHLAEVPGARTALEALESETGRALITNQLADLLASMHAAWLDQPDLHAKNALIDEAGQAWAIDFHVARFQRPGDHLATYLRDLTNLAASHRESLPLATRQRFLLRWLRKLPAAISANLPPTKALAAELESRATEARRATCAAYQNPTSRFFRISSSMSPAGSPSSPLDLIRPGAGSPNPDQTETLTAPRAEVEAAWGRVARIAAHNLPGPRPQHLDRRDPAQSRATFDYPGGPANHPALPPSLGQRAPIDAALASRGLVLTNPITGAFRWQADRLLLSHEAQLGPLVDPAQVAKRLQKRANRRIRRNRLAKSWPAFCTPAMAPFTRAALALAARAARFTSAEARLRRNLAIGLPERYCAELTPLIRRHMARIAFEWGQLANGSLDIQTTVAIDPSIRHLEDALAQGRGAILITPHIGNWELVGPALVARGLRGAVIGRRRLRDPSGMLLEEMRAANGLETLPQDTRPRDLLRRLQDNQIVGILPDLEVQRLAGLRLPFLGQEALVVSAPAALARASRAPLIPAACIHTPGATPAYTLHFGAPIAPPATRDETAATTAEWIAVFEVWIRKHPEQWLWIHDRWRTPPSPADSAPLAALRQIQTDQV